VEEKEVMTRVATRVTRKRVEGRSLNFRLTMGRLSNSVQRVRIVA